MISRGKLLPKMDTNNNLQPKSIKKNYLYNLAYEVFALLTPLITTPYISRVLGAEGVGIYSYTYSLAQYFVLFGNLGVMTYGQMVIAGVREDKEKTSKAFFELWILRFITMSISLGLYAAISFMSMEYREARLILGIFVFAAVFDFTWLFRGIEDFSKVVIRNFIVKIFMIAMIFAYVKTKQDVNLYIFFIAMSTLLGNITFFISIKGVICRVPIRSLKIGQHIKPTLVFFIPTIATSVYTLLDKTMIGLLTEGTVQNGYYEQAHKIEQMLLVIITSLNTIMRSRMAYLYQHGKLNEMRERLNRSISFILMIAIPMSAGLIAISPVLIPWFLGKGFEESIVLLQIFSLLLVVIGLSNCLNTHFLGPSGRQAKNNYVLIVGAVINFVCNYISIPKYGAIGAAIASVVAELLILIGYLYLIRDFFKIGTIIYLGWRNFIAGMVMYAIVSQLRCLNLGSFALLITQIVSGIGIYLLILLILRDEFLFKGVELVISTMKNRRAK